MARRPIALVLAAACLSLLSPTQAEAGASYTVEAAEVWVLPDFDPYSTSPFDWFNGNNSGAWIDGLPLIGQESLFISDLDTFDTVASYLGLGAPACEPGNFTDQGTCSHQLVTPGSVNFSAPQGSVPSSFADAIALGRTAPDSFDALGLTGFSFSGADAAFFDLDPAAFTAFVAGTIYETDLQFSGTEARDYAALLELETDTPGLTIPYEITGRVTKQDSPTNPPSAVPSPTAAGAGLLLLAGLATRRRRRNHTPNAA